jgi:hypothetical protein
MFFFTAPSQHPTQPAEPFALLRQNCERDKHYVFSAGKTYKKTTQTRNYYSK